MSRLRWVRTSVLLVLALLCGSIAHAQQCGPMDVVFVVDNTASMTEVINQVQTQVNAIADTVTAASGGNYQFGLVVAPQNDVNVLLDMSPNNREALATAVGQMGTVSSCGEPAEWDEGLSTVLNNLGGGRSISGVGVQTGDFAGRFRAEATKIIIIITDADPGGATACEFRTGDDALTRQLATQAAARGILISTVFVPTTSAEDYGFMGRIRSLLQDVASTTESVFLETKPDASDLANIIQEVVITCGTGGVLIPNPKELHLENGDTGTVSVTNYRPGSDFSLLKYGATGLPSDSTVSFTRVTPVVVAGTDLQSMKVTIGTDTTAGFYVVPFNVINTKTGRVRGSNLIYVYVGCVPPMILGTSGHQPDNAVLANGSAKLKVVANGSPGFDYQWYHGFTGMTNFPVGGATSDTLTTSEAGDYWVRISNACGTVDSRPATVSSQ